MIKYKIHYTERSSTYCFIYLVFAIAINQSLIYQRMDVMPGAGLHIKYVVLPSIIERKQPTSYREYIEIIFSVIFSV